MKKLLLLPLLVVVCLVGDTTIRVLATTETTVTESSLANISTRAFVQTGDNLVIGGFIVEGAQPNLDQRSQRESLFGRLAQSLRSMAFPMHWLIRHWSCMTAVER